MTSLLYSQRQKSTLVRVKNPQFLDYTKKKNFVSFFLSDGDNIQWMMNDFKDFYNAAESEEVRFALGEAENPHDLLIAETKANVALQYTVAVRDKLIDGYKEIMQMSI